MPSSRIPKRSLAEEKLKRRMFTELEKERSSQTTSAPKRPLRDASTDTRLAQKKKSATIGYGNTRVDVSSTNIKSNGKPQKIITVEMSKSNNKGGDDLIARKQMTKKISGKKLGSYARNYKGY